jgi:hypothetical protein
MGEERPKKREVFIARVGGGIARTSLGCYQHPFGLAGGFMGVILEVDRKSAGDRSRRIQCALDASTPCVDIGTAMQR